MSEFVSGLIVGACGMLASTLVAALAWEHLRRERIDRQVRSDQRALRRVSRAPERPTWPSRRPR